jgi:hypothetical protein
VHRTVIRTGWGVRCEVRNLKECHRCRPPEQLRLGTFRRVGCIGFSVVAVRFKAAFSKSRIRIRANCTEAATSYRCSHRCHGADSLCNRNGLTATSNWLNRQRAGSNRLESDSIEPTDCNRGVNGSRPRHHWRHDRTRTYLQRGHGQVNSGGHAPNYSAIASEHLAGSC